MNGLHDICASREAYIQRDAEINRMKNEVKEMEAMYNGSKRDVVVSTLLLAFGIQIVLLLLDLISDFQKH